MNRFELTGRLGQDPTSKTLPNGQVVVSFSMAENRIFYVQGANGGREKKEETNWFWIQVWGSQGQNALKFLRKGRKVLVEGRLSTSTQEGHLTKGKDKDGNDVEFYTTQRYTNLTATRIEYLDAPASQQPADEAGADEQTEEVPF